MAYLAFLSRDETDPDKLDKDLFPAEIRKATVPKENYTEVQGNSTGLRYTLFLSKGTK